MRRSVSCHRCGSGVCGAQQGRLWPRNFGTASTCAERSTREVEEMSATRPRGFYSHAGGD